MHYAEVVVSPLDKIHCDASILLHVNTSVSIQLVCVVEALIRSSLLKTIALFSRQKFMMFVSFRSVKCNLCLFHSH